VQFRTETQLPRRTRGFAFLSVGFRSKHADRQCARGGAAPTAHEAIRTPSTLGLHPPTVGRTTRRRVSKLSIGLLVRCDAAQLRHETAN
jgi:hypothetical protein